MLDGIGDDVSDVLVGQRVCRPAPLPFYPDQPGSAQHPKVLGDERLAQPQALDQFVHEPWLLSKLHDDRQPGGCGQHPEQLARRLESFDLRRSHQYI